MKRKVLIGSLSGMNGRNWWAAIMDTLDLLSKNIAEKKTDLLRSKVRLSIIFGGQFEFYNYFQSELKNVNPNLYLYLAQGVGVRGAGQSTRADFDLFFQKPAIGRKTVKKCRQAEGRKQKPTLKSILYSGTQLSVREVQKDYETSERGSPQKAPSSP